MTRFQFNPFTDKLDISGMGPNTTQAEFLTGNDGVMVPSDAAFNINVVGENATGLNTTGNIPSNTLTIHGLASSTTQIGVTAYATNAQAAAQTSTTVALTPSNITSLFSTNPLPASQGGTGLSSPAANSLLVTNGSSPFTVLGVATNGELPIGSVGSAPVLATLTQGAGVTITNGPGSITIAATGSVAITFDGDTGSATPSANVITISGGTTGLTTTASGSTVSLTGTLNVGHGGLGITTTPANGAVPIGNGTNYTAATLTQGTGITITNGSGTITIANSSPLSSLTIDADSGTATPSAGVLTLSGGTTGLTTTASGSTVDLTGTLKPVSGGTGVSSPTAHTLPVAEGSSNFTFLGPLTNGQLLIGSTGADPSPATLTAGTGVSITNGAGSITVAATGGGLTWTDVSGTSQAMAVNSGYTADNAGLVTLTLPSTAAYGSIIRVSGKGAGGWKIAQNAGQTIHFGSSNTTTGTGGSLASTLQYDVVELLCSIANTDFTVLSSVGNITVV